MPVVAYLVTLRVPPRRGMLLIRRLSRAKPPAPGWRAGPGPACWLIFAAGVQTGAPPLCAVGLSCHSQRLPSFSPRVAPGSLYRLAWSTEGSPSSCSAQASKNKLQHQRAEPQFQLDRGRRCMHLHCLPPLTTCAKHIGTRIQDNPAVALPTAARSCSSLKQGTRGWPGEHFHHFQCLWRSRIISFWGRHPAVPPGHANGALSWLITAYRTITCMICVTAMMDWGSSIKVASPVRDPTI